jgi:hypothetical protein
MPFDNYSAWEVDANDFYKQKTRQDKLKFLLNFAILAPSSHNTQPWCFSVGDDFIDVFADNERYLERSDKTRHLLYIALGCALENLKLAANHFKLSYALQYNDELNTTTPRHVARLDFGAGTAKNSQEALFSAISRRASNRSHYQDEKFDERVLSELQGMNAATDLVLTLLVDSTEKRKLADIVGGGMKEKMGQRSFRWELAKWLRVNFTLQDDGMPGSGHGMSLPVSIAAPFILRFIDVSKVEQRKAVRRVNGFPAVAIISSRNNTAQSWVGTGELLQRALLRITAAGMAANIMVAGIESDAARAKLAKFVEQEEGESLLPQVFWGFGKPYKKAPRSPRRNINAVLCKK